MRGGETGGEGRDDLKPPGRGGLMTDTLLDFHY